MCEPNWEALAEINVRTGCHASPQRDEPIYCLCSRVHVKIPPIDETTPFATAELEELSESYDVFNENACENLPSNMNRVPKEASQEEEDSDANSCYYSASVTHTDNYCTTDEHERDSGADTSEYHATSGGRDCPAKRVSKQASQQERNSSLPDIFGDEEKNQSWEKYWSEHGEQLIWSSWIEKYSDFINPNYKMATGEGLADGAAGTSSANVGEQAAGGGEQTEIIVSSCSSPPMDENARHAPDAADEASVDQPLRDLMDSLLIPRCDSVSSSIPLTIGTTDSMTNVTQMTVSSFGFSRGNSENSQHDSTPSSLSTPSNVDGDETKIELFQHDDSDQHWQMLWQNHFQEEYARHYHAFISKQKNQSTDALCSSLKEDDDTYLSRLANMHEPDVNMAAIEEASGSQATGGIRKKVIEADIEWDNDDYTNELAAMGLPTSFGRMSHGQQQRMHATTHKSIEDDNQNYVKSAFALMGFAFHDETDSTEGRVTYRKRNIRFHNSFLNMKSRKFKLDGRSAGDESKDYSSSDETDSGAMAVSTNKFENNATTVVNNEAAPLACETIPDEIEADPAEPLPLEADTDNLMEASKIKSFNRKSKKKRRPNRYIDAMPSEIRTDKSLHKYWSKRFSLFSLFDQGIRLDRESWFSVTPEKVAAFTAERCACDLIIDAFCGAGGNTIQFAKTCRKVIAIDIDPDKIEMAKHNAQIYGVLDRIEFIVGDFFELATTLKADVVFLSPPWGGPEYLRNDVYDIECALQPQPATILMRAARKITPNIAIYLPRNTNTQQLLMLAGPGNSVELEQGFLDRKLIAITAYYGNLLKHSSK